MKKIIFIMALIFSANVMNAQTAVQTSEIFDNVYVGVDAGVGTPLSFSNVFPLNETGTLRIGKMFTPVFGTEIEGTAWFGSNSSYGYGNRFDSENHNAVRGIYTGVNGLVNLTNLFVGYNGAPRFMELSAIVGTGWLHTFTPNNSDKYNNYLGAKTGVDLAFNIGKNKAHTINVRPSVLWNLSQPGNNVNNLAFNKNGAQLHLSVGYTYHFGTSNGTRHFKTYDIASYERRIALLNEELAKKPKEVVRTVVKEVPVKVVETIVSEYVVFFAQNSAELTNDAKKTLNAVTGTVTVRAYASPEGSEDYNTKLSQDRADAVTSYLKERDINVIESIGLGVNGDASNRVAIITLE